MKDLPDTLKSKMRDHILVALGRKEPEIPKLVAGNVWNQVKFFYDSFHPKKPINQ